MSYTGDPSYSPKDLIRFLLQDTESPFVFTNEEITATYAMQGDDMAKSLDMLCVAFMARASAKPQDEQIEGLSITWGDQVKKYQTLRATFAQMSQAGTLPTYNGETTTQSSSLMTYLVEETPYGAWQGLPR
jgi:hypothetical protein